MSEISTRKSLPEKTRPLFEKIIPELEELSGIAVSKKNPAIFWTHNDGISNGLIYAVDRDGNIVDLIGISYRKNSDIEDIAVGTYNGKEYIFIGDVGDNDKIRSEYQISMIEEPVIGSGRNAREIVYNFVYSDGKAYDCEAIAYTPYVSEGTIYLITKAKKPDVFKLELSNLKSSEINIARKVGRLKIEDFKKPSAADISRCGTFLVIRNSKNQLFVIKAEQPNDFDMILESVTKPVLINCPPELNGEAVAICPNNKLIYTASEGQPKIIYEVSYDLNSIK